jgi:hypothetical protein
MARQRPKEDKKLEHRITYDIVVDAYNEVERAPGWYCYLDSRNLWYRLQSQQL